MDVLVTILEIVGILAACVAVFVLLMVFDGRSPGEMP